MSTEPTPLEAKKQALSRETEMYKHAIEEQVHAIKQNAGDMTKKVLMVGAGLTMAYFVTRAFMKNKDGKKLLGNRAKSKARLLLPAKGSSGQTQLPFTSVTTGHEAKSPIADLIKQQIAIFLIGIATQKLQDYLNSSRKHDQEPVRTDDTQYTETIYIS